MELGSQWVPVGQRSLEWEWRGNWNEYESSVVTMSFTFQSQYFKLPVFCTYKRRWRFGVTVTALGAPTKLLLYGRHSQLQRVTVFGLANHLGM